MLNKTQPHFSIWKHLPTNISNKILSDLSDTIKPIKLLAITIPDSALWKYPQMFLFPPGRASIKKALCSARLGSTYTKKTLFSAQIGDYLCRSIRVGVRSAISRLSFSILKGILLSVKTQISNYKSLLPPFWESGGGDLIKHWHEYICKPLVLWNAWRNKLTPLRLLPS